MKSRPPNARSSRPLSGADTAGLPATVTSARIRPSPGVSISSARHTTGSSPNTSGSPRTRLAWRPKRTPRPTPGAPLVFAPPAAGQGNIAPPSRSRFPVRTLHTSTSHEARVPNSWAHVPSRA